MKILFVGNHDSVIYKFRKEMIISLIADGHDIYVSAPTGEYSERIKEFGCKYIVTDIDRRGMNPFNDIKYFFTCKKIIKDVKPDIILTFTIKPNIYAGLAAKILGYPCIMTITGMGAGLETGGFKENLIQFLYKIAVGKKTKMFFQNSYNMQYFKEHKLSKCPVILIPGSGVDLEQHKLIEYPQDEGEINILFIGRVMKEKGVNELLLCAKIIKKEYPQVNFQIIGGYDGNYKGNLDDAIAQGIIQYLGYQNQVDEFLAKSHALINPTYFEGMSNVLLEACACGRPVLASNIPGCKEIIDDGRNGFLFETKNVDSTVNAVRAFLALSNAEKKEFGLYGRQKVEKEFDRQIIVSIYKNYISEFHKEKN